MSLIGRFFGSRDDVPEWARFFTPEEYRAFVEELSLELGRRSLRFELGDGTVTVTPPSGEPADYGLLNLAQTCHATPRVEWAPTIREHFDNAFRSSRDAQEIDARADRLDNVREWLKVRLYHTDYLSQMGDSGLIHRQPADGLVETLVYDLPGSVRTVPPDHARGWGVPVDELFRLGLANVRAERPGPVLQTFDVGKGAVIRALVGDSFFTASHILFLEEHLGKTPEFGALVAVPHRHAALFYPIADLGVMAAVNSMIPIAFGMYQEGPGSLSSGLYWWRPGRLTLLPTKVTAQSITFSPPDEFVTEVLNRAPDAPPEA
ncbi:MAG: hypothetical protein JO332_12595 [Planctomycetaceae bacterium]|nr:hypothetical protein [Planctomycetaceae bacterium]